MNDLQGNSPDSLIQEGLQEWIESTPTFTAPLLETVGVILLLAFVRYLLIRIVNRQVKDPAQRYRWRKNLAYGVAFLGFLMIGRIWFEGFGSLATFLGLLSAGLVIALRDPIVDMAGWLFILWRKPFDVGDRIQVGENRGDVIDVRLFKFSILEIGNWVHADQSTGRVIHVPNHLVFKDPIANYTSNFEFIWNEIEVFVTFESEWKRAKKILEEIANDHLEEYVKDADKQVQRASQSYLIRYSYLTPIVYTEGADSGIKLTLRHLTDPRRRRGITQNIWEDILDRFGKEDSIDFAYQTFRIFRNPQEAKSGLRHKPTHPDGGQATSG
ncbi:MAG: mechanosensitive ion channel family protein [Balneolaceae bacterium]